MLEAQRIYGSDTRVRGVEGAVFGINLYATVPEDASDRQPLLIDGHLLVADLRVDNRDELARSLGLAAELRAAADSELLLRAWLRWGKSCLDRIVGDYAFALYEVGARKLTLVRDCMGQRPLFFSQQGERVDFASMPGGLLTLPQLRQGLNFRALALTVADLPREDDSTYFQDVQKVLPGQIVSFSPLGRRALDFWQPSLDELRLKGLEDYIEAYRDVLDEAVGSRLRRLSGPIAAHLSSGLDSSAVATTAARLKRSSDQIIAFTAAPRSGFREPSLRGRFANESDLAAHTASMHAMRHEVVRTRGSGLSLIKTLVATSQEPACNILNQDWFWSIEQRARDMGCRVLLTGEYGNATLHAGGLRVLAHWIDSHQWIMWWNEARCASQRADISWRGILLNSFERWLPQAARQALYRRFLDVEARSRSAFMTETWMRSLGDRIETGFLPDRSGSYAEHRLRSLRRSDYGTLLKGSLARHGIDSRSPLADRRVVEFGLRLPPEQMFFGGVSQPLARRALSDRVPHEVLNAQARGYQSADWFENIDPGEVRSLTEEIAASPAAIELIDVPKIHRALADWPSGNVRQFGQYQQLAIDLPNALATGLFILEAERWMSGRAQALPRSDRSSDHGPRDDAS